MDHDTRMVLTVEEVAERLGLGLSTAYELIHAGSIRARQVNRKWLIPKAALTEYLEGRDNPARVMNVDEVAGALGVHRDTVSKLLHAGAIRARRVGKTWKVPLVALEEFLAGQDNPPQESDDEKAVPQDDAVEPTPEEAR